MQKVQPFPVVFPEAPSKPRLSETEQAVEAIEEMIKPSSVPPAAVEMVAGFAAGAALGSIAGPPGLVAGAIVGSAVGAAAGLAASMEEEERRAHDEEIDRVIGVSHGDIGAASPDAPPPSVGAFSAASMGARRGGGRVPSGGPISGPG